MDARIWIEAEHLAEDVDDFCNVVVYLPTGERYALNVWTFDFFTVARAQGEFRASPAVKHLYMRPPDLFVQDLTRPTLERVIVDVLERGALSPANRMPADAPDPEGAPHFD